MCVSNVCLFSVSMCERCVSVAVGMWYLPCAIFTMCEARICVRVCEVCVLICVRYVRGIYSPYACHWVLVWAWCVYVLVFVLVCVHHLNMCVCKCDFCHAMCSLFGVYVC